MARLTALACSLGSICLLLFAGSASAAVLPLAEGWALQSSARVKDGGEAITAPGYKAGGLVPDLGAQHGGGRAGEEQRLPGSLLRDEHPQLPGDELPASARTSPSTRWRRTAPSPCPGGTASSSRVPAGWKGQTRLAALRRHQLPRQHLGQRQADRQAGRGGGGPAHLRVQHHRAPHAGSRTSWRCRSGPPRRTSWPSPSSTGTRPRRTSRWGCGARSTSAAAARLPSATPP